MVSANVGFLAQGHTHPIGHNRPVEVTFQFLLVGRLAIELSGWYSASKLMTALAQPGQIQPFCVQKTLPFRRPDHVTLLPFK